MTPMSDGLMPTVRKASTSCVIRVASVGFVMRFPEADSREEGRRGSVLRKTALCSGARTVRSQQVEGLMQDAEEEALEVGMRWCASKPPICGMRKLRFATASLPHRS